MHYLAQTGLENSVGGPRRLRELLKPRQGESPTLPSAIGVESVLCNVDGCLRRQIGMSFDLDSFDALWFNIAVRGAPQPREPLADMDKRAIETALKAFGAYYSWKEGAEGQAMPDEVRADHEREMEAMKAMGARLHDLGTMNKPGSSRHYRHQQPLTPGRVPAGSHRDRFRGIT